MVVWSPVFVPEELPEKLVADILPLSSIVTLLFCISFPVVESKRAIALSVAEAGHTTSPVPLAVLLIVIVSVPAFVVIVTFVPATNVSVSVFESATTSDCPLTDIVLNESVAFASS